MKTSIHVLLFLLLFLPPLSGQAAGDSIFNTLQVHNPDMATYLSVSVIFGGQQPAREQDLFLHKIDRGQDMFPVNSVFLNKNCFIAP